MTQAQVVETIRSREYETIYVLRPDVVRDNAERIASRVEEVVNRENGKLTLVETWGRRQLAYGVTKFKRGVYVYLRYIGGGKLVHELERNLRVFDEVIKYQTVRVREDVDLQSLQINPEDVKFEPIEPPQEQEVEESRERALGLEPAADRGAPEAAERRERDDDDDDEMGIGVPGLDEEDET